MGVPLGADAPRHDVSTVDDVLALVRESGGRVTNSRRLLLEAIFDDPGHHSAEDLAEIVQARAPDVHLSTIYRNLEELERLGVIVHSHLGHGPATYHLAASAHCHFVCEHCGDAVKAPDELFVSLAERRQNAVRLRHRPPPLLDIRSLPQLPIAPSEPEPSASAP